MFAGKQYDKAGTGFIGKTSETAGFMKIHVQNDLQVGSLKLHIDDTDVSTFVDAEFDIKTLK